MPTLPPRPGRAGSTLDGEIPIGIGPVNGQQDLRVDGLDQIQLGHAGDGNRPLAAAPASPDMS